MLLSKKKLVLTLRISACWFHTQQVKVTKSAVKRFYGPLYYGLFWIYIHFIKRCFNSWIVRELQNNEITTLPNGIFATNTRQNYLYVLHNYDTNTTTEVCPSVCLSVYLQHPYGSFVVRLLHNNKITTLSRDVFKTTGMIFLYVTFISVL